MTTLEKSTLKRILSDIKQLNRDPLDKQGIYYKHDESKILKGYAMIIGPESTPYQYGYYFFEIDFPSNYPHSPPKFTFRTNDQKTRFHPNFYRSGKCCVSILNTWKGEQWTSCLTLSSILLTIRSLFDSKPLLNEPGIREDNLDFENYNEIIKFKNVEVAILEVIEEKNNYKFISDLFNKELLILFDENKSKIKEIIDENKAKPASKIYTTLYKMFIVIDYDDLDKRFIKLK